MENEVKVCVGIISYLPDDWDLKVKRAERINRLIKKCDLLFNVPIMIIAQNWKGVSIKEGTTRQPIIIHNYENGLGIVGARKALREKFLDSEFDYMIMLDDDCDLGGKLEDGANYIKQIQEHPNMFSPTRTSIIKLFAISKEVYKLIEYPIGGADDENPKLRYFEDMYIENCLRRVYPDKMFITKLGTLVEVSNNAWDEYSTWNTGIYDSEGKWTRKMTGDQTRGMMVQATKETLLHPDMLNRSWKMSLDDYNKWTKQPY